MRSTIKNKYQGTILVVRRFVGGGGVFFVSFLQKICRLPNERIRVNVLIYPDLKAEHCIQYWSEKSGLSADHFTKCVTIQGRHKTNRLSYGICIICVSSTYLKVKILKWLKLLPKELMGKSYYESM